MLLQTVVGVLAHTYHFLCQAQAEIALCQKDTLCGIGLFPVLACHVYHRVSYFAGADTFAAGEYNPFGCQPHRCEVTRCKWKDECVAAYLVEDAADELVVRNEVVYEVFGRICKLRKRLLYFYFFGQVYECSCTLQTWIPQSVQLVTFCTCGFDALVGYLQVPITLLHLP